jgi:hypothetical protein
MGKATKRTRENRTITIDFRDEATYSEVTGEQPPEGGVSRKNP